MGKRSRFTIHLQRKFGRLDLSRAESTMVNCTGVLNVADNTEFILTVTGFKAGATDSNEVKVTLVAADESVSREFIVHVDKVRPGADGKSPVI